MQQILSDTQSATTPETVVGATVKIQGDLNSDGDITIHGQVSGTVSTKQLVQVSQGAVITANVSAGNAIVGGHIQGNMNVAGQLTMLATARIEGDISCAILRVEDGAYFSGKCAMGEAKAKISHVSKTSVGEGEE